MLSGNIWERNSFVVPLFLLVLSAVLHFTGLGWPHEVVFDEVHFGKFVTSYCCSGERFFDIHPPHAKLLTAGTAYVLGYRGGFGFDHIGQSYGAVNPAALRFFSALTGTLLPVVIYWLLRQFGLARLTALGAALLVLLDNALLTQTRLIALDGLLLVAQFGALTAYLKAESPEVARKMRWIVLTGVLVGLAAGTKFTGLAILGLLGLVFLYELWNSRRPPQGNPPAGGHPGGGRRFSGIIARFGLMVAVAAMVYLLGWMLHFSLLTNPGSGDVWGLPSGYFVTDLIDLHRKMLGANYGLQATHPYMSPWWTWPVMGVPVFYWQGGQAFIYFFGNPALWWASGVLFVTALAHWIYLLVSRNKDVVQKLSGSPSGPPIRRVNLWILGAGYLLSFLPLVRVPRALFLYHYATPFLFALLFGLVWLDRYILPRFSSRTRWQFWVWVVLAAAVFFVWFSPLTFGFEVSPTWQAFLFWFPSWRSGIGI